MSQSVSTRDKLISSAVKVFSEKGFFNTKVSDIVKEAGVAQGTFYIYFRSKEEIFLRITELVEGLIDETIERYRSSKENIREVIYSFAEEVFYTLDRFKEVSYIFFFQLLCMQDELKEKYINIHRKFVQFYRELLSEYENNHILADMIVGFGEKLFKFDVLIEGREIKDVIDEFKSGIDIILRGIR